MWKYQPRRTQKWLPLRHRPRPVPFTGSYVALTIAVALLLALIWYLEWKQTGVWQPWRYFPGR